MQVSIIIISYNNLAVLQRCLASIFENSVNLHAEIIIVDNNSSEPIVKFISDSYPEILVISNDDNLGFGKANNIGAEQASGEYLLFINNDVILKTNPIPQLISFAKSKEKVGLVGIQLLNDNGTYQPSHYTFPKFHKRLAELLGIKKILKKMVSLRIKPFTYKEVDVIKGAFLFVSKDLFLSVGGFDEYYFMYVEDVDLSYAVWLRGFRNYILHSNKIIHLGSHHESTGNKFVYINRNKGLIYFYSKYYSKAMFILFLLTSLIILSFKYLLSLLFDKKVSTIYKEVIGLYYNSLYSFSLDNSK